MKREKKDFNDPWFTQIYIKNHSKLQEKLGFQYTKKLSGLQFRKGKILDCGCGFGAMDIVIAREFPDCEISGIDLSDPLLDHANQLKEKSELSDRISFTKGDVTEMPFNDNTFDVVFNINMVHWIDQPVKMLKEIKRVLKTNGFLFIKDLRYSWLWILEGEIKYALKTNDAAALIKEAGLEKGILTSSLLWWEYEIR
jgi:ubiquinone/menaquinone biosynthesis C-methylase UbiE